MRALSQSLVTVIHPHHIRLYLKARPVAGSYLSIPYTHIRRTQPFLGVVCPAMCFLGCFMPQKIGCVAARGVIYILRAYSYIWNIGGFGAPERMRDLAAS